MVIQMTVGRTQNPPQCCLRARSTSGWSSGVASAT